MKYVRLSFYVLLCSVSLLLGLLWVLLTTVFGLAHKWRWHKDSKRFSNQWRPWVAKRWKYSTTLGAITFHPEHLDDERLNAHECVHIRQFDDQSISTFLAVGLVSLVVWVSSLWLTIPAALFGFILITYLGNTLGAVLRGDHVYRDAEHERSAYAQTDLHHTRDGVSWLQDHLSRERKF